MKITTLGIEGAWLVESPVWSDERGFFREWFKFDEIKRATGINFSVAQANISSSHKGVIRGIHYSLASEGQAKWVTCASGRVLDVIVDIRPNSPTFKEWVQVELDANEGKSVFLEGNLGHAFLSLDSLSTVSYLLTSNYSPSQEYGIDPLDTDIGIQWPIPISEMRISAKDQGSRSIEELLVTGKLPE